MIDRSIWSPGAWLAGFIMGTTKHCYIQNIEALGLVVSEIFFSIFPHSKSIEAICCHGNHNFDTKRIYGGVKAKTKKSQASFQII